METMSLYTAEANLYGQYKAYNAAQLKSGVTCPNSGVRLPLRNGDPIRNAVEVASGEWKQIPPSISVCNINTASKIRKLNCGQRMNAVSRTTCPPNMYSNAAHMVMQKDERCAYVTDEKVERQNCPDNKPQQQGRPNNVQSSIPSHVDTKSENLRSVNQLRQLLVVMAVATANEAPQCDNRMVTKLIPGGRAKEVRFNELCPAHQMVPCIEGQYRQKNGIRLCIDKCEKCPLKRYNLNEENSKWSRIEANGTTLQNHLSCYTEKIVFDRIMTTVRFRNFELSVRICDRSQSTILWERNFGVKVLKEKYFDKIRSATPSKASQPLILSYSRFWVEIKKDDIYLSIEDSEALINNADKSGKKPIISSIGAYVNNTMEVQLAIKSSVGNTGISFVWHIRKEWALEQGVAMSLEMRLKGNNKVGDWTWFGNVEDLPCPSASQKVFLNGPFHFGQPSPPKHYSPIHGQVFQSVRKGEYVKHSPKLISPSPSPEVVEKENRFSNKKSQCKKRTRNEIREWYGFYAADGRVVFEPLFHETDEATDDDFLENDPVYQLLKSR